MFDQYCHYWFYTLIGFVLNGKRSLCYMYYVAYRCHFGQNGGIITPPFIPSFPAMWPPKLAKTAENLMEPSELSKCVSPTKIKLSASQAAVRLQSNETIYAKVDQI